MCLNFESYQFFYSQSDEDIRPDDEMADLLQKSLLPGPSLEVMTGIFNYIFINLIIYFKFSINYRKSR